MTEAELRAKVVKEAAGWLGVSEGTTRHRALVQFYNAIQPLPAGYTLKETDSWCAAFVSVVGAALHISGVLMPECSCGRMVELYQKAGRWVEDDNYVPATGDLIFYGWNDSGVGDYTGWPDHVGIVQACEDGTISAIEGNRNNQVSVRRISVGARFIRGYAVPDYASLCGPEKLTGFPDVPAGAWYEEYVLAAARAGILTGYPDGSYKPEQAVTRAELAAVTAKLLEAVKKADLLAGL